MKPKGTIQIAIAGAAGYTGSELLRILHFHPRCQVVRITSEQHAGRPLASLFPQFRGIPDLGFEPLDAASLAQGADLVFLALPHTLSMKIAPALVQAGVRVIDLSADFRLKDASLYPTWYHVDHAAPDLLPQAVYGLPELHREAVRAARFVANPGCYPTCALLALAPLVREGIIETRGIVVDAKSSVSGAGKTPAPHLHFPEAHESLMAYRVAEHQHTPEIEQEISALAGRTVTITFTPHLIPMNRGLLCTIYGQGREPITTSALAARAAEFYGGEPFLQVLENGAVPNTRDVRGTNRCAIGYKADPRTGRVLAVAAIDNLVKGAAGQAVQNMNLMMGFEETTGLDLAALVP